MNNFTLTSVLKKWTTVTKETFDRAIEGVAKAKWVSEDAQGYVIISYYSDMRRKNYIGKVIDAGDGGMYYLLKIAK